VRKHTKSRCPQTRAATGQVFETARLPIRVGRLLRMWACVLAGFLPAVAAEKRSPNDAAAPIRGVDALPREQRRAFLRGTSADWRNDTDAARALAPPPIQKAYPADAKRVDLVAPERFTVGDVSAREVIGNRRSRREFSAASFSLEELSYLLWATQGIARIDRDGAGQVTAHYRTVPSGGARHPFESYVAVSRVTGLAPGLYRYLPVEHQLLLLREDADIHDRVMAACYGQTFIGQAAVTFIWSAVPYRTEWKYGVIAQKLIAIEAGHVCQNLYLAVESLRAGVCSSMGYSQARLDALLGLDGTEEFVVYLASAGKCGEAPDSGGTPEK